MTLTVAEDVVAFHARPETDEENLVEDVAADGGMMRADPGTIATRLGGLRSARVLLCGHSHRSDLVRLDDGALVLNPGSVGCPAFDAGTYVSEAGSPHARYALLDLRAGEEPRVAFLAVPYDHEAAARQAEAAGQTAWAAMLRTGLARRAAQVTSGVGA
jgi:diadenosine tetraphosphatase ApaH/serine/threonine PP2A family protein phosphatase